MKAKVTRTLVVLMLLAAAASLLLTVPRVYSATEQQSFASLRTAGAAMAASLPQEADAVAYLAAVHSRVPEVRISWIGADGGVIYDSDAYAQALDNHRERPEVEAALRAGEGTNTRLSGTLGKTLHYYALRLDDGTVLRIAAHQQSVMAAVMDLLPSIILLLLLLLAVAFVVGDRLGSGLARRINQIDLDAPTAGGEGADLADIAPLLTRMAARNDRVSTQLAALTENGRAFATITENMTEGLVVLAADGTVLSLNHSAERLFRSRGLAYVGRSYVMLHRDVAMHAAIKRALQGEKAEAKLRLSGRVYELVASPVMQEGGTGGAVLLLLDISERELAEANRREFSANVSHELKTPLTTITGYAEMLRSGLVRPEDSQAFAGKIHAEAQRMTALVEDIIALSKLDEGSLPEEMVDVDLSRLSREITARLAPAAAARGIELHVGGEAAHVRGVPAILDEMIANLVDNGIKYGREGGSVRVDTHILPDGVRLTVADTGVGIAPEHQEKVFERFYRVDKSHSRATGGTGLGLSIVKHGAMVHGARVALQSEEGAGTVVTVEFLGA